MNIDDLTLFVMTRDRYSSLSIMLSTLVNNSRSLKIHVSDNSTIFKNIEFSELCGNIVYVRRSGDLNLWEHFSICANESKTKYTMILHDDDYVHDNFLQVVGDINEINGVVSYGLNSQIRNKNGNFKIALSSKSSQEISSKDELINRYITPTSGGYAMFPYYIYKTEPLKSALVKPLTCGIYSDIEVLFRILDNGYIQYDLNVCNTYCWHGENLSSKEYADSRLKLYNLVRAECQEGTSLDYLNWLLLRDIYLTISRRSHDSLRRSIAYYKEIRKHVGAVNAVIRILMKFTALIYGSYKR